MKLTNTNYKAILYVSSTSDEFNRFAYAFDEANFIFTNGKYIKQWED